MSQLPTNPPPAWITRLLESAAARARPEVAARIIARAQEAAQPTPS